MQAVTSSKFNNNTTAIDPKYAVIYARYSSSSQTEQSIEGQLRVCNEYATKLGYKVINEYVDRAKTGTNARRPAFQNMIADSEKGQFQVVLVYMIDRFARSKEDSVVYKSNLRRNGVKVISATEAITDTDEGYLVEGFLEMMAEMYSTKLSKRVKNGLNESRIKGTFTGGHILYGYKVVDKKVMIDEEKAPAIRYAFEAYAKGVPKKVIVEELNRRGYRTNKGAKFTINSFYETLRNTKYIGVNYFNGQISENSYPVMIEPAIFEEVQKRLDANKHAPATQKAIIDYVLYGKAFCGYCGSNMVGVSGTSKTGAKHHYYACATKYKHHTCKKKNDKKELLEKFVVENIIDYVTIRESADRIADLLIAEYQRNINDSKVKDYEKQLRAIDKQLDDIVEIMLQNTKNTVLLAKLDGKADDLTAQKEILEEELAKLRLAIRMPHTKNDILNYLAMFTNGSVNDPEFRKRIIDRLVNTVYVYDDKILTYLNILDDRHIEFESVPDLDTAEVIENKTQLKQSTSRVRILSATLRQKSTQKSAFSLFKAVFTPKFCSLQNSKSARN